MGVSVMDTRPEMKIAVQSVTANSLNRRPIMPPMNNTGMNTAPSEMVMDTMVNPISREPRSAAWNAVSPFSICRTMFSSITMASSTTKPMQRISAIIEMLSRL